MNIQTKKYFGALAVLIIVAGAGASLANADTTAPAAVAPTPGAAGTMHGRGGMMGARKPGVAGTVTAISGNTITITAKQFAFRGKPAAGTTATTTPPAPTTTTYTIDDTNATVTKAGAASSASGIAVGDMIMAQGTVTGTNVAATAITDGFGKGMMGAKGAPGAGMASLPAGNGQPIVGGAITAISGTTITITNASGVTYTVDASTAKFSVRGQTAPTIASVAVGDSVIVQGAVTGNAVTAATVTDQGAPKTASTSTTGTTTKSEGFFGGIGSFFKHIFGF